MFGMCTAGPAYAAFAVLAILVSLSLSADTFDTSTLQLGIAGGFARKLRTWLDNFRRVFGMTRGSQWYVDSTVTASGNGKSWGSAFKTIAEGYAAASAGDIIHLSGSFAEVVTCAKAGIRFLGEGTGPKQAIWAPVADDDQVNLTISAAYVEVAGIYFSPGPQASTYSACIVLGTGAQHARIHHNHFQGSADAYYAIHSPAVGADNVHIKHNKFMYFNTATYGAAILGVNAGGFQYSGWEVTNNLINSCVIGIKLSCKAALVEGNVIQKGGVKADDTTNAAVLSLGIDLTGDDATNSGGNTVTGNVLDGAYTTALYKAGSTGDCWYGNRAAITADTAPYGLTVANPAA